MMVVDANAGHAEMMGPGRAVVPVRYGAPSVRTVWAFWTYVKGRLVTRGTVATSNGQSLGAIFWEAEFGRSDPSVSWFCWSGG